MHFSEISPVLTLVVAALGTLGGLATLITSYWSNVRPLARRQSILDFASKRVAFWDQALKLELAAATGEQEQSAAKMKAFEAVQRIKDDADKQLERSTWSQMTNSKIFARKNPFRFDLTGSMTLSHKLEYVYNKLAFYFYFTLGMLWLAILLPFMLRETIDPWHSIKTMGGALIFFAYVALARFYNLSAERLTFAERPDEPLMARV